METNANDNLDGFMKQTKYFLQSKTVQAILTIQCTGIYHISKWQALCSQATCAQGCQIFLCPNIPNWEKYNK
jgi:hypothetical protein